MDVSDGLAVDLGHIARRSGVRCVVELERVPLAEGATSTTLGFGEDFELLAAVPEPGGSLRSAGSRRAKASSCCSTASPTRSPAGSTSQQVSDTQEVSDTQVRANAFSKCFFGRAPCTVSRGSPPANRITVGSESTP